jgi:ABC-type amino acid transport substrate-binding protein
MSPGNIFKPFAGSLSLVIILACSLLSPKANSSSPELPNYGIFLSEGGSLTELRQYTGRPKENNILSELAGASSTPTFLVWIPQMVPQYFSLVHLERIGTAIPYKTTPVDEKGEILEITPGRPLADGIYCFYQGDPLGSPYSTPYWCFRVGDISSAGALPIPTTGKEPVTPRPVTPVAAEAGDLLSTILARGAVIIAIDPNYAPVSMMAPVSKRPSDTKCASDQMTSAEMTGFDTEVSNEIARRLGVEPCFVAPKWDWITAGKWENTWDVSVGSMAITPEREKVLFFTSPYYYDEQGNANGIAVDKASTFAAGSFVTALDQIVREMHQDRTLSSLSQKWFGKDQSQ